MSFKFFFCNIFSHNTSFYKEEIPLWATGSVHRTPHRTHIFLSDLPAFVSLLSLRSVVSLLFTCTTRACGSYKLFLWSTCLARIPTKHSPSTHHAPPWCSDSVNFLFDSATIPDTFSTDADWNQIKLLCTPPRGWTVWPSGYTTSHHIPSKELCEEPDRMFSKNCVVWTSTWASKSNQCSLFSTTFFCPSLFFLWRLFWKFCFYSIFSFLLSIFSVKKHSLLLNRLENTISPFCCKKKHSVCALCCWGLCFGFAICCWFYENKTNFGTPFYNKNSSHVPVVFLYVKKEFVFLSLEKLFSPPVLPLLFRMFYWQLSVLWSQWHGHQPRVIRCIKPSHFISLSSHFTFLHGFLFFYFFYDNVFFVVSFWCPSLIPFLSCFLLFWSSLRVSNFFCLPSFWQKIYSCFISSFSICFRSFSFSVSSSFFQLLFFQPKNLSLLLCTCFSLFSCFFFKEKLFSSFLFLPTRLFSFFRCLQCFLVHFFVFFCVFFFWKKFLFWSPFGFFKREIGSPFSQFFYL